MNTTTEYIVDTGIYGIHKVKPDHKKRIAIPTEWRELLSPGSDVHILYTGHYLIIVPAHLHQGSSDNFVGRRQISNDGRVLIGDKLLNAIDIKLSEHISLIGKGNHIELYYDERKATEVILKSQQLVSHFQETLKSKL